MENNIYAEMIEIPTPYPVGPINVYLFIADEKVQLVDCGPLTDEAEQRLTEALAVHGCKLTDITEVYITHAHPDHAGLSGKLSEYGAKIFIHPLEYERMYYSYQWLDLYGQYLAYCGVKQQSVDGIIKILSQDAHYTKKLEKFEPLEHNSNIVLGGEVWQCIQTPGHAIGHICMYQPERKWLLSGDTLLEKVLTNSLIELESYQPLRRFPSLKMFHQSFKTLQSLTIDRVLPAHGPEFTGVTQKITDVLTQHEIRRKEILNMLNGFEETPYVLCEQLFGPLKGFAILFALSEVLGYLDLCHDEGLVEWFEQNGTLMVRQTNMEPISGE